MMPRPGQCRAKRARVRERGPSRNDLTWPTLTHNILAFICVVWLAAGIASQAGRKTEAGRRFFPKALSARGAPAVSGVSPGGNE